MQPSKDRDGNDLAFGDILLAVFSWNRTFSAKPLVQSEIVVPGHIFADKVFEVLLMKDNDVIQCVSKTAETLSVANR